MALTSANVLVRAASMFPPHTFADRHSRS